MMPAKMICDSVQPTRDAIFHQSIAAAFIPAYAKEAGVSLEYAPNDELFPDLRFRRADRKKPFTAELVEVIFNFIIEEKEILRKYEKALASAVSRFRPRFSNRTITLQASAEQQDKPRPYRLPKPTSPAGKALIDEFLTFLERSGDRIVPNAGILMTDCVSNGIPEFPLLTRYFSAVLVSLAPSAPLHPDDPGFDLTTVTSFNSTEIQATVLKAFQKKYARGISYSADALVLHTFEAKGKPYVHWVGMHLKEILAVGYVVGPALRQQFGEVWFFNSIEIEGRRLYRLA